jgi:hypothetical protein
VQISINILSLTDFIVKGDPGRWGCQGIKDRLYVLLGSTCNTDEKIRIFRHDEVIQKVQHLFTGGWCLGGIRALIESIQNDEDRKLSWRFEHVPETIHESGITGLVGTIATLGVQLIKNTPAKVRVATELEDKGRQQATEVTL